MGSVYSKSSAVASLKGAKSALLLSAMISRRCAIISLALSDSTPSKSYRLRHVVKFNVQFVIHVLQAIHLSTRKAGDDCRSPSCHSDSPKA